MKKLYIAANWKSNKTILQAEEWFRTINNSQATFNKEEKEIIVCAPFILLPKVKELAVNCKLPIAVGAQDVSPFNEGAYTGEVNGKQIKEFADFVIIGHSERRINFGETDEILFKKNELARENGLATIYCVQGKDTRIPANVDVVVYEPIDAIGTGHPDSPENADSIAAYFKASLKVSCVLYGGSVTAINVRSFTQMSNINGVLIGKASLDAKEFCKIIKNA